MNLRLLCLLAGVAALEGGRLVRAPLGRTALLNSAAWTQVRASVRACAAEVDISSLRAGEIKRRLAARGISTASVFEKDELVRLLFNAERAQQTAVTVDATGKQRGLPLKSYGTKADFGALETSADAKLYRGFELELLDIGLRLPFVIDTASSNTLISPALADRFGSRSTGAAVTLTSATGGLNGLQQVRLGSVRIGGVPCGTLDPVVMGLPIKDDGVGLLGLDMIARLDLDLRFSENAVLPYRRGQFASEGAKVGLRAVPCALGRLGLLTCQVRLGAPGGSSTPLTAIIDSGSPFTIANWAAVTAAGILRSTTRSTGQGMVGISGQAIPVDETLAVIQVGVGGSARSLSLSVADLPIFEALGMATSPAIIVGLDVLGTLRLALSVGTGTMWVQDV